MKIDKYRYLLALEYINQSSDYGQATERWLSSGRLLENSKAMISFSNEITNVPHIVLNKKFGDKAYQRSLIGQDYIYFLDKHIVESYKRNINAHIKFDYSISFDTNFASYLLAYTKGKNLGSNHESFVLAIENLLTNDANYDYNFYIIENIEMISKSKSKNVLFDNLLALKKLMTVDKKHFYKTKEIISLVPEKELVEKCDGIIEYHCSKKGLSARKSMIKLHKVIYLILLKICHIKYCDTESRSVESKILKLLSFYHYEICAMFMRELIAAHFLFTNDNSLKILNKLKSNSKSLVANIKNTAWDFTHIRFLERCTAELTGVFKYYFPCILSFDRGLVELVELDCKKSFFLDKKYGYHFLPASTRNTDFLYEMFNKVTIERFFGEDGFRERSTNRMMTIPHIDSMISSLEDSLHSKFS